MAAKYKHRLIGSALPYITNLSPTDPTPRYISGSNVMTSSKGYAERRPGLATLFAITQQSSGIIRRLFQWEKWNGDIYLLASLTDTSPYSKVLKYKVNSDTDWVVLTAASDTGTSEPYDFAVANNHLFMANGSKMLKYDGTTVTNWGIDAPSSALTIGTSATGLTGTYSYVISWLNNTTGHISSPSPVASVTLANQKAVLSGNTTSDSQVTHVNLYRTAAGGSTLFKHPASPITYATWTGSGYTDSTADTALSATVLAPVANQNNRPPAAKGLEWYQGRLWVFTDDKVYYSGFEEIPLGTSDMPEECFPPDNYFPFGKRLTGVAAIGDPAKDGVLGVFSPGALFYVAGDSLNTFTRGTIATKMGTRNRATIAKFRKLVAWLDSTNTIQVSDGAKIYEISLPVRPDLASVVHSSSCMFVHSNGVDQWLILVVGDANSQGAGGQSALVYDLDREQWMPPWTFSGNGLILSAGQSLETAAGVFRAVVVASGYTTEFVRSTYQDAGFNPGSAEIVTNSMELPSTPDHLAAVRHIGVERASTGTLTLKLLTDEDATAGGHTSLSAITGNPSSDPRRTQGSALVDSEFKTESGPWCRRASVLANWGVENANFKLYSIDVAYEENG